MRSHISVHRATIKYFSNLFVFKNKIEKEGLPRDDTPALGAGGLEFKSPRPDQTFVYLGAYLDMLGTRRDLPGNRPIKTARLIRHYGSTVINSVGGTYRTSYT